MAWFLDEMMNIHLFYFFFTFIYFFYVFFFLNYICLITSCFYDKGESKEAKCFFLCPFACLSSGHGGEEGTMMWMDDMGITSIYFYYYFFLLYASAYMCACSFPVSGTCFVICTFCCCFFFPFHAIYNRTWNISYEASFDFGSIQYLI